MAITINIDSQLVVKTAAQWAADATVYSAQRILITSDETYSGTDQRKFKIANGTDTWSNLDYFPVTTVSSASEVTQGIIEIATQAETDAEIDDARAVTPSKISNWLYNVYLNAAVTISGLWSFVSKLRITSANQSFYTEVAAAPTSNQVWTIPDEGTQTFASKAYAVAKSGDTMTGLLQFSGTTHAGLRLNNVTTAERQALTPSAGMVVFDTDLDTICVYTGTFWQYEIELQLTTNFTTTSSSETAITGLSFTAEPNSKYLVDGYMLIGCSSTGGSKFAFDGVVNGDINHMGQSGATTNFLNIRSTGSLTASPHNTSATQSGLQLNGAIVNPNVTSTTFQFTCASNVAGQTTTIFEVSTCIKIKRVS